MLENAARICETPYGLYLYDGQHFSLATHVGAGSTVVELMRRTNKPAPRHHNWSVRGYQSLSLKSKMHESTGAISHAIPYGSRPVEQAGATGLLGVPMLKDNQLVGAFVVYPTGSSALHR